jgi:hypothetical protein
MISNMETINTTITDLNKLRELGLIIDNNICGRLNVKLINKICKEYELLKEDKNFYDRKMLDQESCFGKCESCDVIDEDDNMKECIECTKWLGKDGGKSGKIESDFEIICHKCIMAQIIEY